MAASGTTSMEGGGKYRFIESMHIADISFDPKKLSKKTLPFLDPADKRLQLEIRFKDSPYRFFWVNWLIMGIDDQYDVKCLIPIEETIRYTAGTHGGSSTVHGSCLAIYDAIQLLPVDQRLDVDTEFSLTVPLVEAPYAKAIFSESITPITKIPSKLIPFNRRNLLLFAEPGESLSMHLRVGYTPNFSIRERTHWWPLEGEGLAVGTQLGRDPIAYLQTIVKQLMKRIGETENNRFDYMLRRAGSDDKEKEIREYVIAASQEILALASPAASSSK